MDNECFNKKNNNKNINIIKEKDYKKIIESQSVLIKDLTETVKVQNNNINIQYDMIKLLNDRNKTIMSFFKKCIITVVICVFLAQIITTGVFYYNYFNSDWSDEIREHNTTTYNYNERKETINKSE